MQGQSPWMYVVCTTIGGIIGTVIRARQEGFKIHEVFGGVFLIGLIDSLIVFFAIDKGEGWLFLAFLIPAWLGAISGMATKPDKKIHEMLYGIGSCPSLLGFLLIFFRHIGTPGTVLVAFGSLLGIAGVVFQFRQEVAPTGTIKPTPATKTTPSQQPTTTTTTKRSGRGPQRGGNRRRW